ncbi:MAG TPA: DUF1549 domain-containing protein [Pirellulales bacterium]|jgi:hypothetical protein
MLVVFIEASLATAAESPIAPRRPELPAVAAGASDSDKSITNPIDRLLAPYYVEHKLTPPGVVEDRVFARRAFLDCVGVLPTPAELDAFLADSQLDKRAKLVERLLADRDRYAQHWLTFWNDALRNDYQGTGYIDGGRKQITGWLYKALADNMPYDQFVRELVSPTPASEGFIKGITWRGTVNASQTPEIQAAQNVSQVFLGINMKCASCHDSFINNWKLADAYGLAGIFAEKPVEMHRCDRPTGEFAPLKFLYPELGAIDASASRKERMQQVAALLTSPNNGRLTRTMVNRVWAKFLGRGLVEPVDEMDDDPWNQDLLDWLAADLQDHGYDLKRTMALVLTSRAYQAPSVGAAEAEFVFRGPIVRRMEAEQFADAVSALTGVWQRSPAVGEGVAPLAAEPDAAEKKADAADPKKTPADAPPADPKALVAQHGKSAAHHHGFVRFSSPVIQKGKLDIDVDIAGASTLWLVVTEGSDGQHFDWANWGEPKLFGPDDEKKLTDLAWKSATSGYNKAQVNKNAVGEKLRIDGRDPAFGIGTHAHSVIVYELPPGVTRFTAQAGPDTAAVEKSKQGHSLQFLVLTDVEVRAALATADPLITAMGRPNREQVVTSRPPAATTLEALELTNGQTLDETLKRGAARLLLDKPTPDALLDTVYAKALGRKPTDAERRTAQQVLGQPMTREGVEDLLWIVTMLPEFQLIY